MKSKLFSVMERRDDLPAMRWPMAALFILLTSVAGGAAARLATPAAADSPLSSQNIAGLLAAVPFLPLAVALYAQIILLWRRIASLLATPATFAVMLLFGADLTAAVSLTLALLLMSYVFAVSLITKETRFRRTSALALSAGFSLALCLVARAALDYGSLSALAEDYMNVMPAAISRAYTALTAGSEALVPDESVTRSMARELFVMLPAFFGVLCVVLAWAADRLIRRMFVLIGCPEIFTDERAGVTMPFSYAAVYAVVFVSALFIPSEAFPFLSALFRSVLLIMALPCAAVGVKGISEWLEDRLFYMTREKVLAAMLLFVAFVTLRAYPFLLVTSAVGAWRVIRLSFPKKPE